MRWKSSNTYRYPVHYQGLLPRHIPLRYFTGTQNPRPCPALPVESQKHPPSFLHCPLFFAPQKLTDGDTAARDAEGDAEGVAEGDTTGDAEGVTEGDAESDTEGFT